jgi:osmotically-inducible protein OsmY
LGYNPDRETIRSAQCPHVYEPFPLHARKKKGFENERRARMAKLNNLMQNSTYILLSIILFLGLFLGIPGLAKGKGLSAPPTDGEIEGAIERRLEMDSRIQENKIGVKVEQGHATLFGQVESLEEKGFAEKVALTIRGVQSLVNKLEVPPDMSQDTEIASSIKQKLRQAQLLHENNINVRVDKQVVTLDGTVRNRKDKREATRLVENTKGVREVQNLLKITDQPRADEEIYKDVVQYLMWASPFNNKDLTVSVDNGTVTLEGTIDQLVQRDVLKIDIGNIHGVDTVEVGKVIPADLLASPDQKDQ